MSKQAFYHGASQSVRFWVQIETHWIGASIREEVLHYRYCPQAQDEDPMQTFRDHAPEIESAVQRRVAQGAREPVMLREVHLRLP